jgi:catechol 2,3-dioxygenase-like lactoylglutathione lyase family enzyme
MSHRSTLWMCVALALGLVLCAAGCKRSSERSDALIDTARACAKHGDLSCPRPILHVRSLHASQRYYRDALGFRIDWEHGDPPDFGSVSRGDSILFMCQGCQGNPGSWMWIFAPDVDRLHAELVRRGAIIKLAPTNMPWGVREMHVADPDGNVIRFASPIED